MENIKVKIKRIVYQKDDFVIAIATYDGEDVSVKGVMPGTRVDAEYELSGGWSSDKYGRHFKVESSVALEPSTRKGIEAYLGSGMIAGIGPTYAKRIVDRFGEDTLEILNFRPERLSEVPGIGKKRLSTIMRSYQEQRGVQTVMLFLKAQGITNAAAARIYRKYGNNSIARIKENPYILADEIFGIGFKTADSVALSMGYEKSGDARVRAGILFALETVSTEGHTFCPQDELVRRCCELLDIGPSVIERRISSLEEDIIIEDGSVYLPWLYYAEKGVARVFREKSKESENVLVDISEVEEACGCTFAGRQREAIRKAMSARAFILTGGPGTGKTFTMQGIITALEMAGEKVLLAAPTGRAAKRLAEVTGREAKTIHRLLEYAPNTGFGRDATNPLKAGTVIVDEASMVDIQLMNALLKALKEDTRIILVGDSDQLPSVGAGNVLCDLIGSGKVPCVVLDEIFRQAQDSQIIMNAHDVNKGIIPSRIGKDFFIAIREDRLQVQEEIVRLVTEALPARGYKTDEVQVLSPMRRSGDPIAATELNRILQSRLNPDGEGIRKGLTTFRPGDRVMQMKNDYSKNVFNGDTGKILSVDVEDDSMDVAINGDIVTYYRKDFEELELAYASTIHKSQGSEYKVVIVPVHESQYIMLERNLLYTAITRAKEFCILIGTRKAIALAVSRHSAAKRYSRLAERLQ